MSQWSIELEFVDNKSKKFWRARAEGATLHVNFGRLGTAGQTKVKDLADASAAMAELDKLAASKRKKGYADIAGGGQPTASAPAPAVAAVVTDTVDTAGASGPVTLRYQVGGRDMELTLRVDDATLKTELVERYADADAAAVALRRIHEALVDEGYR